MVAQNKEKETVTVELEKSNWTVVLSAMANLVTATHDSIACAHMAVKMVLIEQSRVIQKIATQIMIQTDESTMKRVIAGAVRDDCWSDINPTAVQWAKEHGYATPEGELTDAAKALKVKDYKSVFGCPCPDCMAAKE